LQVTTTPASGRLADRIGQLKVESAFAVLVRARELEKQGRSVIHLEIGEPDFPTPPHIVEAGKRALDAGFTKYGPTAGLPELRESIAGYVSRTRGIRAEPDSVCVTPGAKPIMFFTMLALLEPGDEVIYPDPGFPIYESMIRFAGAAPVPIPLTENRGFSFDPELFRSKLSDRTRLVVLNSPQNPTGGVIPEQDLAVLARLLRERDVMVLSDEIYSRLTYDGPSVSIASFEGMQEKTIILDGFSKTYSMTGWRLGYGVMPGWLAEAVNTLMVNSNSCTAAFTQQAGIAALEGPQDCVDEMAREFRRRRDAFCAGLNTIAGFRCPLPAGAFYAFCNIEATGIGSKELADYLLNEAGVACLNGAAFGDHGNGYIRFSYASSMANLMEAVERIRKISSRWAARKE
jgi:aspartate/methionine/tyrosine aminotransferase